MNIDDLGVPHVTAASQERPVAIPPAIAPDCWEEFAGFRETFLADFTVPGHNAALRRICDVLSALIGEAYPVMPKTPEGWYRTRIRAVLADLRFIQGFLAEVSEASVIPSDEPLARLVRRKTQALEKIADAIEGALAEPGAPVAEEAEALRERAAEPR